MYSDPGLETARRRAAAERPLSARTALLPQARLPGRPGQARVRPGATGRHAAPDGDGGVGDRERRRAHAALPRRAHPRAEREGGRATHEAERGRTRDEAVDRRSAHGDDGLRRLRRHRHCGADPGCRGGWEDGNGRDGRRGPQHDVVRCIRAGAEIARSRSQSSLENQTGTGGTTAAPIAREIMTTALGREGSP